MPFLVLLLITLISDAYHDLHKHQYDFEVNHKVYEVCDGAEFKSKLSKDIKVGDVIQIREHQLVPADILLLCVKGGENEVYVDMRGVIGEMSFGSKKPIKETMNYSKETNEYEAIASMSSIHGIIKVPQTKSSDENKGVIRLEFNPKSSLLTNSNIIQRGSKLIDTQ